MASKSFCFWSFIIFFCVHFGSRVQGNELQQRAEKGIDGSVKNTSTLHANALAELPIQRALYSESDGNRIENDTSKIYIESGSIWNQPVSASINLDANGPRTHEFAILRTHPGQYFSAKATMSVYALYNTDINQQSLASVWVMNLADGPPQKSNIISAGWHHVFGYSQVVFNLIVNNPGQVRPYTTGRPTIHSFRSRSIYLNIQVHPKLYDDKGTRFFVAWWINVDGKVQKGCYNLQCNGFILLKNSTYIPGSLIEPLSIYNGEQRYITMKITKDSQTGDWWLYCGSKGDQPVGYWPKTLFTSLADSATNVDFGGAVAFDRGEKGPPMGSGVFPSEGEGKAASLTNLQINNILYDPHDKIFYTHQTLPDWYQIDGGDQKMYFGGPGGYQHD